MIKPGMGEETPKTIAMEVVQELKLHLVGILTIQPDEATMKKFYKEHAEKPFYDELVKYTSSGPCYVYFITGENCLPKIRTKLGSTNPEEAAEGTWRKRFGKSITENVAHASATSDDYNNETSTLTDFLIK